APVAVQQQRAIVGEQVAQLCQRLIHPAQVAIEVVPGVMIGRAPDTALGTGQRYPTGEVETRRERRVDIDKVDLSGEVREQRRKHMPRLASDEPVEWNGRRIT